MTVGTLVLILITAASAAAAAFVSGVWLAMVLFLTVGLAFVALFSMIEDLRA